MRAFYSSHMSEKNRGRDRGRAVTMALLGFLVFCLDVQVPKIGDSSPIFFDENLIILTRPFKSA